MAQDRPTGWRPQWHGGPVWGCRGLPAAEPHLHFGNMSRAARRTIKSQWQTAGRAMVRFFFGLLTSATTPARREDRRVERNTGQDDLQLRDYGKGRPHVVVTFRPAAAMGMQAATVNARRQVAAVYPLHDRKPFRIFRDADRLSLLGAEPDAPALSQPPPAVWRRTPRQETAQRAAVSLGLWLAFPTGTVWGVAGALTWAPPSCCSRWPRSPRLSRSIRAALEQSKANRRAPPAPGPRRALPYGSNCCILR